MTDQPETGDVTALLVRARKGEAEALDEVFPLVYRELRSRAAHQLRRERPGHTLQPTALVNEAYMKLVGSADVDWRDRAHFVAVAARAMRQILVDHARRKGADKRGGGAPHTTLAGKQLGREVILEDLVALDDALNRLDEVDSRLRQVVECRFFGGMENRDVAELLGVTPRTVQRDWAKARAWLYRELYPESDEPPPA